MTDLLDIRFNEEEQYYEICTQINHNPYEEFWVPAATHYISHWIPFHDKISIDYTMRELLEMEGWVDSI